VVQSSLVLVDLAVRSLMNEYGLSREGALRFLQTQALHHELDLRDAALNVVVPGAAAGMGGPAMDLPLADRPAAEPPQPQQDIPDGAADWRLPAPAELDQQPQMPPGAGAAKKQRPPSRPRRRTA
jgi:hypothetical protein